MANVNPTRNPANTSDMSGMFREVLKKFLLNVDDMIPAKIVAYDRLENRATVQPLLVMLNADNQPISRNQLASIPVFNIGGGGFIMSFPMKEGDLGWIKAADRDIAEFLKEYKESQPATKRVHNFSNGLFIPDVMTGYDIAEEDEGNAVLQTLDGTVRISLFPDKLKVTAPLVEVDSPNTNLTGNITNDGNASLGNGGSAIARLGDSVEVTVTRGSSSGIWSGTITSASTNHTAT